MLSVIASVYYDYTLAAAPTIYVGGMELRWLARLFAYLCASWVLCSLMTRLVL